eukprot:TRINITY_DN1229_c0_g1_i15.p1 TRINITY_DN1229_c0_g1~~TRINITY_DN1229_c0_g1_i15.p1  ORF type:complete len:150 (-),score=50.11 TRINITY_DN1229_c0_g1_i15:150-599(-)
METKKVAFYAIVGKQGEPIFMKNFIESTYEIDLEFAAYSSLDYIEERYLKPDSNDMYLGLLYSTFIGTYELNIYAYITNMQIKYILFKIVADIFKTKEDEVLIRRTFTDINRAYLGVCINPFLNGKLMDKTSPLVAKFEATVDEICQRK